MGAERRRRPTVVAEEAELLRSRDTDVGHSNALVPQRTGDHRRRQERSPRFQTIHDALKASKTNAASAQVQVGKEVSNPERARSVGTFHAVIECSPSQSGRRCLSGNRSVRLSHRWHILAMAALLHVAECLESTTCVPAKRVVNDSIFQDRVRVTDQVTSFRRTPLFQRVDTPVVLPLSEQLAGLLPHAALAFSGRPDGSQPDASA
eukprot:3835759-Pleurochrysis_carterae.AAC.5